MDALYKKILEESKCYLEIVPEVCNIAIPDEEFIDWMRDNNSYEYSIPLVYKVRLNKKKTDSLLEIYQNVTNNIKMYYSCVDLIESPLISTAEFASGDVVRHCSENLIVGIKPESSYDLNSTSNQINSENSNYKDQEIQTVEIINNKYINKIIAETTVQSQQTDIKGIDTDTFNNDYKLLRDIESILEASKLSIVKADKSVNSDITFNDEKECDQSDNPGSDNSGSDNRDSDNPGRDNQDSDNPGRDNQASNNPVCGCPVSDDTARDNSGSDNPVSNNPDTTISKTITKNGSITLFLNNSTESRKLCLSPIYSIDTSDVDVKNVKISTSSSIMYTQKTVHGTCIETYNYIPRNVMHSDITQHTQAVKTDSVITIHSNKTEECYGRNQECMNTFVDCGPIYRPISSNHGRINEIKSFIEKEILPVKIGFEDLLSKCWALGLKSSKGWIICNKRNISSKETRKSVVNGCAENKFHSNRVVYSYVFEG